MVKWKKVKKEAGGILLRLRNKNRKKKVKKKVETLRNIGIILLKKPKKLTEETTKID